MYSFTPQEVLPLGLIWALCFFRNRWFNSIQTSQWCPQIKVRCPIIDCKILQLLPYHRPFILLGSCSPQFFRWDEVPGRILPAKILHTCGPPKNDYVSTKQGGEILLYQEYIDEHNWTCFKICRNRAYRYWMLFELMLKPFKHGSESGTEQMLICRRKKNPRSDPCWSWCSNHVSTTIWNFGAVDSREISVSVDVYSICSWNS